MHQNGLSVYILTTPWPTSHRTHHRDLTVPHPHSPRYSGTSKDSGVAIAQPPRLQRTFSPSIVRRRIPMVCRQLINVTHSPSAFQILQSWTHIRRAKTRLRLQSYHNASCDSRITLHHCAYFCRYQLARPNPRSFGFHLAVRSIQLFVVGQKAL